MKFVIAVLILIAVYWVGNHLFSSFQKIEKQQQASEGITPAPPPPAAASLPGLPESLEASLSAAQAKGASGLRDWLNSYRVYVKDPRLASIELDYVVLISHQDSSEARRIFKEVQARIAPNSPVYERVKRLEKTFQ
jgi:hypothetical protein